ncbi:MAG: response regulator [Nitrososphaeraceae archaeon]|nr:response regulator [Nitrososphaeraceae archaeon]
MSSARIEITELETDNIGGQRSKFDVIATILYICIDGSLKNHIVGKGNFSDSMTNHYISILLYNDLLSTYIDNENNRRTYYRTTDKGKEVIHFYNQIQRLFKIATPSSKNNNISGVQARSLGNTISSSAAQIVTKRILIVDDEADITSALKRGLEKYGFTVEVNNNPLSMLSGYEAGYYDLLIIDIKMPEMDGFELYQVIRKLDNRTKVCFWTAFEVAYEQFVKRFPSMNEKFFIKKPVTLEDLVDKINRITEDEKGSS